MHMFKSEQEHVHVTVVHVHYTTYMYNVHVVVADEFH